jgi:quercetin 2,3-dioxygenase
MHDDDVVLALRPLGFPWPTVDPFLFCVHHVDHYPRGNGKLGPQASLAGRNLGMDFEGVDGWRMYHGDHVPGFPQHPHRGFETITVARRGFIDHSDSLGATARFGHGDVQWMTAGSGIVHAEMFPLLHADADNPVELFQIWLNLPARNKMVAPHFSMLWSHTIPTTTLVDDAGKKTHVTVIAGSLNGAVAPAPPPHSWAADPNSDIAIWSIRMESGARALLPRAHEGTVRSVAFFDGQNLRVHNTPMPPAIAVCRGDVDLALVNGQAPAQLLVLQGRSLQEPVARHGPFVMNTEREIRQAYEDYQRTRFGGWPWPSDEPTHKAADGRFAKHADGRIDVPRAG